MHLEGIQEHVVLDWLGIFVQKRPSAFGVRAEERESIESADDIGEGDRVI